jgi:hypothetical protein
MELHAENRVRGREPRLPSNLDILGGEGNGVNRCELIPKLIL